jgi:2-iminobutanoate/2-iminopropanoate deaminase
MSLSALLRAGLWASLAALPLTDAALAREVKHFPPVGPKPAGVPANARAPFSSAVMAGDTLYLAGVLDLDPATRTPGHSAAESARLVMDALKASIAAAGFEMDDLVSVQVFATDLSSFDAFGKVYEGYFKGPLPARTFVGVSGLMGGAHFEVNGIAVRRLEK